MDLYEAGGFILAEHLYSSIDVPPFDQSAMDGYGFTFSDWKENKGLQITGEIVAGVFPKNKLLPNTALRIFTGAAVPENCDTVVMQEKVEVKENLLFVQDSQLKKGSNIRLKASQTKKGELALKAGSKISPGVSGFLAGLGIDKVKVYNLPNVCIISTGKELNTPGQELEAGKIFESNSYSLNAALRELNIRPKTILRVDDDEAETTQIIKDHLEDCDVMILSGGISVGDYDYVEKALYHCGVEKIFHKVKQKPGKPMYFGKKNKTLIFGLPGNPAALLTCFYEYIAPTLKIMMGQQETESSIIYLPLSAAYTKKAGLTHFLKGKVSGKEVIPLPAQESYLMNSFAEANCIIQLDEEKTEFKKGDLVEVHLMHYQKFLTSFEK